MSQYRNEQIKHIVDKAAIQVKGLKVLPDIEILRLTARAIIFATTIRQIKAIAKGPRYRNPYCGCKDFRPYVAKKYKR